MDGSRVTILVLLAVAIVRAAADRPSHSRPSRADWPEQEPRAEEEECGLVPMSSEGRWRGRNASHITQPDPASRSSRILFGVDAEPGEWPWVARLQADLGEAYEPATCTGSLLNSQWVITAGHCAAAQGEPSLWNVTLALYNLVRPEASVVERRVAEIVAHPNYRELNNDLALFRLEEPVQYNEHIQPVCLVRPAEGQEEDLVAYTNERTCVALGYGLMSNEEAPKRLQKLRVAARPFEACREFPAKEGAACVGPGRGQLIGATCRGDSGGPNACYDEQRARWELFATVSFGPRQCDRTKGDLWLTAAVDLTKYLDWITATIRSES